MESTPFTAYRKEHANAANDKPQTPGRTGSAGRLTRATSQSPCLYESLVTAAITCEICVACCL